MSRAARASSLLALLGAPLAWTAHLLASYAVVGLACASVWRAAGASLAIVTAACAAASLGAGWLAYRLWRTPGPGTASLLGGVGVSGAALFTVAIVAEGMAPVFLPLCPPGVARADAWRAEALLPVAGAALYWAGARRLRRRAPRSPVAAWRVAAFVGGAAAVALATLAPVTAWAERSVAGHMVQHLVLAVVAAPALALGRPLLVLAAAGAPLRGLTRGPGLALGFLLARPLLAWLLHAAVLWLWHAPALYRAALERPALHLLEHATLLAAALVFWGVVAEPRSRARLGPGGAALFLFTAALQAGGLGAALALAEAPWYPPLDLDDQRVAGALMWIPGGVAYLAATLVVVGLALTRPGAAPR